MLAGSGISYAGGWSLIRPISFILPNSDFILNLWPFITFYKRVKNEIYDNNEIIYSRFSEKVSKKINFTAYGLRKDHTPALQKNNIKIY